ncbi:Oral-facial-digital syndrome 1 [Gossypium arboreum]|uniref:Oral-facial-digital syndrome 1 n=1 Tax=Gossypium arboreum TaxID=29729 RepID=A0A0B0PIM5_GOSAR|nr:Oral-facial-digital syndrome 1 [Gossypium arboreum]
MSQTWSYMGPHVDVISQIWSYTKSHIGVDAMSRHGLTLAHISSPMPCPRHGLTLAHISTPMSCPRHGLTLAVMSDADAMSQT